MLPIPAWLKYKLNQSESKSTGIEWSESIVNSLKGISRASRCSDTTLWKASSACFSDLPARPWRAREAEEPVSSTTARAVLTAPEQEASATTKAKRWKLAWRRTLGYLPSGMRYSCDRWWFTITSKCTTTPTLFCTWSSDPLRLSTVNHIWSDCSSAKPKQAASQRAFKSANMDWLDLQSGSR